LFQEIAMFEFILANLLFQVAAATALMLLASGSAARDLLFRRSIVLPESTSHEPGVVVDLPAAPRAPKLMPRVEVEAQSEAA
jgi:hypothetical protein